MKYCQGPECHTYRTKDRIRGPKGAKYYATRKRSSFYQLGGNAFDTRCQQDWFNKFGEQAVNHFGRIHEPKRTDASGAWYKTYSWRGYDNNDHYIVNDLLGERIPITQQQYQDESFVSPQRMVNALTRVGSWSTALQGGGPQLLPHQQRYQTQIQITLITEHRSPFFKKGSHYFRLNCLIQRVIAGKNMLNIL